MEVNDVIDQIEHFNTFGKYPFATLVHIFVGGLAGWFLMQGQKAARWAMDGVPSVLIGIAIFAAWCAYEFGEFARIADQVDKDIANGILGLFGGMLIARLWYDTLARIVDTEDKENGR